MTLRKMSETQSQQDCHLLRLPAELRLNIYDQLLKPLVNRSEVVDTYVLPDEWPQDTFNDYTNVRATCKEIREELTPHFEKKYLPDTVLYFDNVVPLRQCYQKAMRLGPAYQKIHFSLRTMCSSVLSYEKKCGNGSFSDMMEHSYSFMRQQVGFQDLWRPWLSNGVGWCRGFFHYPSYSDLAGAVAVEGSRNGKRIHAVTLPLRSGETASRIEMRQICGDCGSMYAEMQSTMRNIKWPEKTLEKIDLSWKPMLHSAQSDFYQKSEVCDELARQLGVQPSSKIRDADSWFREEEEQLRLRNVARNMAGKPSLDLYGHPISDPNQEPPRPGYSLTDPIILE